MADDLYRHPLAALRAQLGLSAVQYLRKVEARHRALGFGSMATRREKVNRWESGVASPDRTAQLAMASLHGVPAYLVEQYGWPDWLLAVNRADRVILGASWTPAGTLETLTVSARGGPVDRRGFLIATGATLSAVAADWAASEPASAARLAGRRRLTADMVEGLEQRLDVLRRLDDVLGGTEIRRAAVAEYQLLTTLANEATYTEAMGRRLLSAVAEAGRVCGWLHFDAGRHAAAQTYYVCALRAADTAADPITGANALAFMAVQAYTVGNPHDAVELMRTAQLKVAPGGTPRVRAAMHARLARALSKAGEPAECQRQLDAMNEQYANGPRDEDPAWLYWIDRPNLDGMAASCLLDAHEPRSALAHFAAAVDGYPDHYPREKALDLAGSAVAHLALGDLDVACDAGRRAWEITGGLDSGQLFGAMTDLRDRLLPHRDVPVVRDFLELAG